MRSLEGWGVLVGVPALFLIAYVYPMLPILNGLQLCAVRRFLRFDCPGCGLKRSFIALAHGRIRESIDLHPLGLVIAVWLVYMFSMKLAGFVRQRETAELLTQKWRDVLLAFFILALFFQWIVKLVVHQCV